MSELECVTLIICLTMVCLTIIIISLLIFIYKSDKLEKSNIVPKIINYDHNDLYKLEDFLKCE